MATVPTVLDDTLLDDPARLAEADVAGLLRAAAMAGAQVRAVAENAAEMGLSDRLDIGKPRALVLVVRPGVSGAAHHLLAALLGQSCPVPLVVTDLVPSWAGPLDVVLAHTDDGGDRDLAASLERAGRYGATVVLSAPPEGPVASGVAGRGLLLPPRLPVPPELAFPRALAAGLLTVNALGLLATDIGALADHLDDEAERDHLAHESFVNPAKSLALRLADRTPLLWGLDPLGVAVAEHAAHAFAVYGARVCDVADYQQAMARPTLLHAAMSADSERNIFADPDDEVVSEGQAVRAQLLAVRSGPAADAARHQAQEVLSGADVLAPAEEIDADEAARAAVLALRFELAAVYSGLAAATIGGAGRYPSATA